MKPVMFIAMVLICSACGTSPENQGTGTPIDSTNRQGTAPVTYGADNPAEDVVKNKENFTDTGTKTNEGPDNTR